MNRDNQAIADNLHKLKSGELTIEELLNSGEATVHLMEDNNQDHQSKELENTLLLYDMLIKEKDKRIAVLEEMVHILHGKNH